MLPWVFKVFAVHITNRAVTGGVIIRYIGFEICFYNGCCMGKFPPEDAKAIADRYPDLEAAAKLIVDGKLSLAQSKYNG